MRTGRGRLMLSPSPSLLSLDQSFFPPRLWHLQRLAIKKIDHYYYKFGTRAGWHGLVFSVSGILTVSGILFTIFEIIVTLSDILLTFPSYPCVSPCIPLYLHVSLCIPCIPVYPCVSHVSLWIHVLPQCTDECLKRCPLAKTCPIVCYSSNG
jgi:hypothetical protein